MISFIVCGMKISNETSEHVNIAVDLIIVFVEFITSITLVCSALYRNDSTNFVKIVVLSNGEIDVRYE